jgi:hypothetical protein
MHICQHRIVQGATAIRTSLSQELPEHPVYLAPTHDSLSSSGSLLVESLTK